MPNGSSVSYSLPLSSLKFSPLLLLEQQIFVNKHASNPAENVLLFRLKRPLSKVWHSHFSPSCIFWGPIPGPFFSTEEANGARADGGLTGDRCVYLRVDVRAVVRRQMLQTSFDFAYKMSGKVICYSVSSMCMFVCIRGKEEGPHASASVCLYMQVFLLLMSACVCRG